MGKCLVLKALGMLKKYFLGTFFFKKKKKEVKKKDKEKKINQLGS